MSELRQDNGRLSLERVISALFLATALWCFLLSQSLLILEANVDLCQKATLVWYGP